jgi:hypothetical protein
MADPTEATPPAGVASNVDAAADLPHRVPLQAFMPWKENWCFAGLDVEQSTAMVWHVSLRPLDGEGIFTCKFDGPELRIRHVGRHPIDPRYGPEAMPSDGRVKVEIVEPHRTFQLSYRGSDADVDCRFTARFAPFDFADGAIAPGTSAIGELGRHVFPFNHYEQSLAFEAEVRRPGVAALHLSGWANRDHSWGWRDDFGFRSHHWICANFDDRYVQGSTMIDTTYPHRKFGGFVSTDGGNTAVTHVDTSGAYWEEPADEPLPELDRDVTYQLTTVAGERITITAHLSERIRVLHLNARHPDRSQVYQDAQVFCPFSLDGRRQRGAGLLELGKHLSGPGIADRVGRR